MDFTETALLGKILDRDNSMPDMCRNCPQPKGEFPPMTPVGMAYVPFQTWERPYDSDAALSRGTIFPSLDKPFIGEEAVKRGND